MELYQALVELFKALDGAKKCTSGAIRLQYSKDAVNPSIMLDADENQMVVLDQKVFNAIRVTADEKIDHTKSKVRLFDSEGKVVDTVLSVDTVADSGYANNVLVIKKADSSQLKNDEYKLIIDNLTDEAGNTATDLGTFTFDINVATASITGIQEVTGGSSFTELVLTTDFPVAYGEKSTGVNFANNDVEVTGAFTLVHTAADGTDVQNIGAISKVEISGNELTITVASTTVAQNRIVKVKYSNTNKVFVDKTNGGVVASTEKTTVAK